MMDKSLDFASRAIILAVVAMLLSLIAVLPLSAAELAIGSNLPSFSLKSTDGQVVSSDGFDGKHALVVVFLDNHCTYGTAYQSRLIGLQRTYGPQGVQFVLINPNASADAAEMRAHAVKLSYPFPFLMDTDQSTAKAFGATRTPEVFLFGPEHKLLYRGQIDDNTEERMVRHADLKLALDAVLRGAPQAIDRPVTVPFGCSIRAK